MPVQGPSVLTKRTIASAFYHHVIHTLTAAEIPFLVGGTHALNYYTNIVRRTKDLDIFVQRERLEDALSAIRAMGYRTEITHPHFLGKAFDGQSFVDVIFSSFVLVDPLHFSCAFLRDTASSALFAITFGSTPAGNPREARDRCVLHERRPDTGNAERVAPHTPLGAGRDPDRPAKLKIRHRRVNAAGTAATSIVRLW
jgi:hypothetical protein